MGALRSLIGDLGSLTSGLLAIPAAFLPSSRWDVFTRLPIRRLAFWSGLITTAVGVAIGVKGFFEYAQAASDAIADVTLKSWQRTAADPTGPAVVSQMPPMAASAFSSLAFLAATPLGWVTDYLVLSGLARAAGAWFDDPLGDPLLTAIDTLQLRVRGRTRTSHLRRSREREEGPEVPDQLFTGEWARLPGVDYVVVASRRKPEWTKGTFVITSDKWYALGEPFDVRLPEGLRTAYPLTELKVFEVLRRGVRYDLPPLGGTRRRPPPQ